MRAMYQQVSYQEEQKRLEANIRQFIEATRQYFKGMIPAQQPALATVRICNPR